jgi:8-oxo-dGTP pyrophosphatase MutT (NUDIX family)
MHRYSSVVLVDERGWVLLQERDEHPVIDPERWGFPGGGVEDGEDFESAAYRELAEETGVHLGSGLLLFREFTVFHESYGTDDTFQLWSAGTALTDADIDCQEGRQIVFVDPAEALNLDLTAAAKIALPEFLSSDRYRSLKP